MGFLSSLGGIAGSLLGGPVGGAIGGLVGGALGGGSGGGGSSGKPVYTPQNLQGIDQSFNTNYNAYQNAVNQNQQATQPYNQYLLNAGMYNPNAQTAQQTAGWAGWDQFQSGAQAEQQMGNTWNYANQQMANAGQTKGLYDAGLQNAISSSSGLYNQANQSNATYQNLLNFAQQQQGNVGNAQNNLFSGGNQVLNTALDPQNALKDRTQQQLTEQNRAGQYARGIQQTPYGAALEQSANENFAIDWQNQQLARQAQGLQAAQGAYGGAVNVGNAYTGGVANLQAGQNQQYTGLTNAAQNQYTNYLNNMTANNAANTQNIGAAQQNAANLGNIASNAIYQSGQIPYQTSQQILQNQNQAIQNYNQNQNPYLSGLNQLQSNALGYMNQGQSAQSQAFNQNAYNQQQNQNAISSIAGPLSQYGSQLFNNSSFGDWAFNALGGLGGSL